MKNGTVRTSIQGQGGGAFVAAGAQQALDEARLDREPDRGHNRNGGGGLLGSAGRQVSGGRDHVDLQSDHLVGKFGESGRVVSTVSVLNRDGFPVLPSEILEALEQRRHLRVDRRLRRGLPQHADPRDLRRRLGTGGYRRNEAGGDRDQPDELDQHVISACANRVAFRRPLYTAAQSIARTRIMHPIEIDCDRFADLPPNVQVERPAAAEAREKKPPAGGSARTPR